jgi:hypothetical protein
VKKCKYVQEQERHDKPREEINSDRTSKLLLVQDTRRRIRIRGANSGSGDQNGRVGQPECAVRGESWGRKISIRLGKRFPLSRKWQAEKWSMRN